MKTRSTTKPINLLRRLSFLMARRFLLLTVLVLCCAHSMAEERRDSVVADRTKAVCYSVASNKNKKKKVKKLADTPKRKGVIGIGDCFGGHDSL